MMAETTTIDFIDVYVKHGFTLIPLKQNSKIPKVEGWINKSRDTLLAELHEGDNVGLRIESPFFRGRCR